MIGAGTVARGIVGIAIAALASIGCSSGNMNGSGGAGTTGSAGTSSGGGTTGDAGSGGGTTGSAGTGGATGSAGTGGHGGSGIGGTGGVMLGCPTSVAPASALIADFTPVDGGTAINEGVPGGTYAIAPTGEPAPSPTIVGGAWSLMYIGVGLAETAVVNYGIYFSPPGGACVDAHTYHGISFKIGGDITGCTLQVTLADSEKTSHTDDPMHGGCSAAVCDPSQKALTLSASPTPVQIAWGDVAGGAPAGEIDPNRLVSLGWQLTIPPAADGGSNVCIANITVDDVMFY